MIGGRYFVSGRNSSRKETNISFLFACYRWRPPDYCAHLRGDHISGFDDSKGSCIPSGGNWFCEELNLSIDFDNLMAILQSGDKTVVCQVIREHNSDYIVLEDKNTHSVLCAGECMDLSEMALEIEESETGRIYHFRKMEN